MEQMNDQPNPCAALCAVEELESLSGEQLHDYASELGKIMETTVKLIKKANETEKN